MRSVVGVEDAAGPRARDEDAAIGSWRDVDADVGRYLG